MRWETGGVSGALTYSTVRHSTKRLVDGFVFVSDVVILAGWLSEVEDRSYFIQRRTHQERILQRMLEEQTQWVGVAPSLRKVCIALRGQRNVPLPPSPRNSQPILKSLGETMRPDTEANRKNRPQWLTAGVNA